MRSSDAQADDRFQADHIVVYIGIRMRAKQRGNQVFKHR